MILSSEIELIRGLLRQKQFKVANQRVAKLVRQFEQDPDVLLLKAECDYKEENLPEAQDYAERACHLHGDPWPEAHALLGKIYGKQSLIPQALESLKKALEQGWDESITHLAYGRLLMDLGDMRTAHKHLFRAWEKDSDAIELGTNLLFATMATPGMTDVHRANLFRAWAAQVTDPLKPEVLSYPNTPDPNKRLRIGYVSADLRYHAAVNPIYPLLRFGNRDAFDIYVYSQVRDKDKDEITSVLAESVTHWVDAQNMSDRELVRRIRQDRIDILVDCSGHTQGNRLTVFAYKPAPIQISAFGFIFTTGMKAMDYQFSDTTATPPFREPLYTERLIQLTTQIHWRPIMPSLEELDVQPPPCEENGYITFGSGNGTFKHNDEVIALWAAILKHVPNSRLHFKHLMFGDLWLQKCFRQAFSQLGVEPERILFSGATKPLEHFQFYNTIDIALDPFPYTGGMTTCETLYMGVPVIALNSDGIRTSQSLLAVAGVSELIAANKDEYGRKAIQLARSPQALSQYRQTLRSKLMNSPIANTRAFIWEIEQAYRHVWRLWCEEKVER